MSDAPEQPQIYLITPSEFDLSTYPDQLAACLDSAEVACVRLALGTTDETRIAKAADALRDVTHARDVALVIDSHIMMVERLGLDGVHLMDAAKSVIKTRKELGEDAIVGTFCGTSSHEGMSAGEMGADYVSFGPIGQSPLGAGEQAGLDLFEWWSMMIEVPVVAEGALDADLIRAFAPHSDFFGIGDEIWRSDDPATALAALRVAMTV
ncbi:thiamine phosphate synthase [Loktanella sp. D2R18]|uniref:thiamine phosphate synthase n=1 Tax=Rhodobacterales TaxID=204455 RepID=UPI000DEB5EF8|nr:MULTISPECIES: thiamine phosphate synthase [Rhodobacterales]MDO6591603.1 thiamine phosphate synthase [Yoonia sp. 1_MG-2023]RBW43719.1 thiamine phosphate synthase [Loktanella sp. D2R18]